MVENYKYENAEWGVHSWETGESISKTKVNNLETGVQIAISLADNILKEIGSYIDPGAGHGIVMNTTRLDKIQRWITGKDDGDYGDNTLNIAARLNNIEGTNTTQNGRLDKLQTWITGSNGGNYTGTTIATRLNSIETVNTTQDGRLGNLETARSTLEKTVQDIITEIGGTYMEESGRFTDSRLDKLQNWMTGSFDGTYLGTNIATRLDNVETENTTQNTALDKIRKWFTGSETGTYIGTNIASRLNVIENKNSDQDTTLGTIKNWFTGSTTGTYSGTNLTTRLAAIENLNSEQNTRLDAIETTNTSQNSKIEELNKWITGYNTPAADQKYDIRKGAIKVRLDNQDSRLDSIQSQTDSILAELGGTAGSGITNSRIDELDRWITGYDNPTSAQKYSNSSSIGARLDSIEEELLGSADSLANSRLDDLEKEIGGTRNVGHGYTNSRIDGLAAEDSANKTRLTELEAIVGGHSSTDPSYRTHDARLGQLENNIGNDLLPNIPISTRVTTVENELGIGKQSDTSIAGRIQILEECCAEMKILDIESLYAFIVSEVGQIVRMEYKMPYTISSSTIELAPGIVDENNVTHCIHYEEATVTCLGNNIWNNSYFTNTPGIENNGQYFFGHASAFKTAFNSFFRGAEWREGIKISFDFNFFDPLKALRLVYDYGTAPVEDMRAYNNESEGWRRISFLNLQNQNGTEMPIYGIKTFFYGQEADDDIVFIKNVQVEVNPHAKDVEPQNPFNDDWTIALPNTMYGATIDLINRKIYETWGHIASYNGEDVGDNWISTTGTLEQGAEVVYELDEPIVHKITIHGSVVSQGFNTVPANKIIIKFNRNVTI